MKFKLNSSLKFGLMLLCFVAFSNFAQAQRTISGTVIDAENNEPLIGATIIAVGTDRGTITDFDGKYTLDVPDGANSIEISYTGYQPQVIELGASNVVDVSMSAGTVLDEVVVVGYGTATQKEVTSAVTSVKADDFNGGNVNDPVQLIQGKVAGLSIARPGGDPNGGSTIRLRGLSSLGENSSPLIIIDGVIGGSLETVDPNDIASIDILKDGSASAIYGTRGAAGVIIVTTKKGTAGQTKVEYNGYVAAESIGNSVPVASAAEFRQFRPADFDRGATTDWLDEVTRVGVSNVHNLALSGGTGSTTYRASVNFRDINGIGRNSGFQQLNGRLNLTQKALQDRLTLSANISATQRDAEFGINEIFRYATIYNPTAPVFFNEGDPLFDKYGGYYQEEIFDYFNPVAIQDQSTNNGRLKDLLLSGTAAYEIIDGLTLSGTYSQQIESDLTRQFYQSTGFFRGFNRNGLAERFTEDRTTDLFEATLNYRTEVADGLDLDILGGYSWQNFDTENFKVEAGDFISDALTFNRFQSAQDFPNARATVESFQSNYKVIGFFGRLNLGYDDTYYLSASLRREGSTRFGEDEKWGLFPGVSASVIVSNLIDVDVLDNLKVRAGYGVTGSLPGESNLSARRFIEQGSFFFNGGFVPAFGPDINPNPNLRFERKGEFNVGLDFSLLDYRLGGTIDFYNRTTEDLIFNIGVPVPPNQADRTNANVDDLRLVSSGLEIALNYLFEADAFTWEPRVVFSTFNNQLETVEVGDDAEFTFFGGAESFFDFSTSPGAPGLNNNPAIILQANGDLGQLYGPQLQEIDDNGQFVFRDLNGDGTTDANMDGLIDEEDKTVIGNGLPDFSLGFASTFKFGDFDFNFFLRGDFGHDLANFYRTFYEPIGSGARFSDNIVQTEFFDANITANPQFSDYYVENASYIALDNAQLGYTFKLPESSSVDRLRVYIAGQNLFFITNYTGVDPTPRFADPGSSDNGGRPDNEFSPNPLAPGLDRRNLFFRTQTFTFGVNVGF